MVRPHARELVRALPLAYFLGCTGSIQAPDPAPTFETQTNANSPTDSNTTSGAPRSGAAAATAAPVPLKCVTKAVGASPMRRLTHAEYDNSVADLLGDTTHPASDFAPDTQIGLFDNTASAQTVPLLLAD